MKKKRQGFTLIELLAVIVILGLLLAIAIPSVTKYITQSRKKTVTTTIGNYIGALTNQVNDMEYVFTESNTVYAVPIECISLERGGTDPFGEWMQANDSYWAYVLVQYDDATSSYTYGFTFKDSAGYGLYPTTAEKLQESGKQIQQDLSLSRPKNGTIINITAKTNWTGFDVEDDTNLVVLVASSEGETGNGSTTCTLCQKGSNYDKAEEEKDPAKADKNKPEDELPILTTYSSSKAFWQFRDKIKTVTFEDSINIPSEISNEYKWDVSSTGNGMVMAYIVPNVFDSSYYDLYIQGDGRIYANPNSSYLFASFKYLDVINNIDILNTSRVTNMRDMFAYAGYSSTIFTLDLGDNFDTSNVTDMWEMFDSTGYSSTVFTLDLGDKFDTSNVTDMSSMFEKMGYKNKNFTLDLGDKFDTSNVTDMYQLFAETGHDSTIFTLDLGDKFDTSKAKNMGEMFRWTGYKSTVFTLDLGDKFDTSSATSMQQMFYGLGSYNTSFTLDLGDKFDTSNVTNMSKMFIDVGQNSTVFTLDLGDKFDTSKVTNMWWMFASAGKNSSVFTLDLGNKFDTSNVRNMECLFNLTGYKSTVFTLDLGDKFDTSNVADMTQMFNGAGYSNPSFTLDLGDKFNTSKVTEMNGMFNQTGYSNPSFTLDLGDKFDTSNVTDMLQMFRETGYSSPVFTLDLGDKFNTSKVTDMTRMFYNTGFKSTLFELDCSSWNVDKVTKYTDFNYGVTSKVTPPKWGN